MEPRGFLSHKLACEVKMRNFLVWSNIRSFSSLLSLVTTKYCSPHILEISEVYERTYCLLQSLKKHCGIIEERWLQIRVCSVTGKNTYEDIELRPWPAVLKPWPNELASRRKSTQVDASLQNQNLRTDLRRVAKRIRQAARKSQKAVNFTHIIS